MTKPFSIPTVSMLLAGMLTWSAAPAAWDGVPRLDPDYAVEVDQWWASHPFNSESPKYAPEIRSPAPVRELKAGEGIQQAIDALPPAGGTIKLAAGSYQGFQIVARSNVHVVSHGGAIICGPVRVASSKEAMDYGAYDAAVSRGGRPEGKGGRKIKNRPPGAAAKGILVPRD